MLVSSVILFLITRKSLQPLMLSLSIKFLCVPLFGLFSDFIFVEYAFFRPFQQLLNCSGEHVEWDDSNEYDCSNPNRGNMIIFNNENFRGHSARPGTEVDAKNLEKTFTNLGFKVNIFYNQTREQMLSVLKKGNLMCFVMVVFTISFSYVILNSLNIVYANGKSFKLFAVVIVEQFYKNCLNLLKCILLLCSTVRFQYISG